MKAIFVFLVVTAIFISSAVAQQTIQQSQAEALRIFPDLGRKDSPLNQKFVALVAEEKEKKPSGFQDPEWPLRLARKAAESIARQQTGPQIAPKINNPKNQVAAVEVLLKGKVVLVTEDGLIVYCGKPERSYSSSPIGDSLASIGGGGGVAGRSTTPKPTGLSSPSLKGSGGLDGSGLSKPATPAPPEIVYGRFLLTNHPQQGSVADGDEIEVIAKLESGTYKRASSTYHIYSFVRVPK